MYSEYKIKKGDTLKKIASMSNSTLRELMDLNGIRLNDELEEGRVITVPKNQDKYFTVYTIKSGDNLYHIAEEYNINPTLLAALNGLDMEDYIYPEQEILIPKSGYSYYITAEGDTLKGVADLFGESVIDLLNTNEAIYLLKDQIIVSKRK